LGSIRRAAAALSWVDVVSPLNTIAGMLVDVIRDGRLLR
jgi:hypothetical protein